MPETAIRPVFPETVLPSAPCVECKAQPEDAGTPARGHSAAVRGSGKEGNDSGIGGQGRAFAYFTGRQYLFYRHQEESDAIEWANKHGYVFDGEVSERFLLLALSGEGPSAERDRIGLNAAHSSK